MDPITLTVIWGVIWFFAMSIGAVIVFYAVLGLFFLASIIFDKGWIAGLGVFFGWLASIAWAIFALVQVILHGVTLFQLLTS